MGVVTRFSVAACMAWALGCTPVAPQPGTLNVQLSGGNFVEAAIPSSEFQDGWSLAFSQLLVTFVDLTVTSAADSNVVARDGRSVLVDLVKPGPHAWASMTAPVGSYDHTAFSVKPATADTVLLNTTQADLDAMVASGFSMLAVGVITHGSTQKHFSWGFRPSTRYSGCAISLKVTSGATTSTRFTLHGEHLFLESLSRTASPRLRAQSQADADGNHDGVVSLDELGAVDGGAFTALQYPDPATFTFIRSLLQYEEVALARSFRLPGEGLCTTISMDSPLFKDGGQ